MCFVHISFKWFKAGVFKFHGVKVYYEVDPKVYNLSKSPVAHFCLHIVGLRVQILVGAEVKLMPE